MEAVFLVLLWILEIAFAIRVALNGGDRGNWHKERVIVRGIELICFMLYMLLPEINYGFRFALILILLLLRFVIAGIIWLCKRKREEGILKKSGLIFRLAGSLLLLLAAMTPAFMFAGYRGLDTTGEYQVKQAQAILVDDGRTESFEQDGSKREVPIYIYYPDAESGEFPLVIFSHGAFGYYQSNTSTYMELASNGYVVVSLDHPYHSFFTKDTDGKIITVDMEFLKDVQYVNEDIASEEEIIEISSKWLAIRTADMNFVIDSLKEAKNSGFITDAWHTGEPENEAEILRAIDLADCDKVGVMGHSLGGAASVSLGRERDDIGAVIDLDGTMLGEELAFENGAYVFKKEPYPVPLLSIDNEEHHESSERLGSSYVNVEVLENAVDGRNTYFKKSGHMNFTDLPLFSPVLAGLLGTGSIDSESCIRQVNEIVLQYYDHYLKGEGEITLKECYE